MVGLDRLEPSTSALSEQCSNQLSYKPKFKSKIQVCISSKTRIRKTLIQIFILYKGCIDGR